MDIEYIELIKNIPKLITIPYSGYEYSLAIGSSSCGYYNEDKNKWLVSFFNQNNLKKSIIELNCWVNSRDDLIFCEICNIKRRV